LAKLFWASRVNLFLLLSSIPIHGHTKSVYPIISWTFRLFSLWSHYAQNCNEHLCEYVLWFLLDKYPGEEWLDQMVDAGFIIFKKSTRGSKMATRGRKQTAWTL
jgi:hypothetical protein